MMSFETSLVHLKASADSIGEVTTRQPLNDQAKHEQEFLVGEIHSIKSQIEEELHLFVDMVERQGEGARESRPLVKRVANRLRFVMVHEDLERRIMKKDQLFDQLRWIQTRCVLA